MGILSSKAESFGDTGTGDNTLRVVYGEDNRKDVYEFGSSTPAFPIIDHSVALISRSQLTLNTDGSFYLTNPSQTLGDRRNLCDGERFTHQYTAAYCSGIITL